MSMDAIRIAFTEAAGELRLDHADLSNQGNRPVLSLFAKEEDQESDPLHELTDAGLVARIEKIAASTIRPRAAPRGAGKAGGDGPAER